MRRPVWIERGRGEAFASVVVDLEALPPADPGGRVRVPLSVLWLLGLAREVQDAQAGVVLMTVTGSSHGNQ
jgi:hypothetical protein